MAAELMPEPNHERINPSDVRSQLELILSSRTFSHAQRLRTMLRFIVEQTLSGRSADLKEGVIGHEVCGRSASFDPKIDPIVRVDASRLRSRLHTYYEAEGSADRVRIVVPKGTYVPVFTSTAHSVQSREERYAAIAVLPFVNLSGVADQEFFSDSLTEQIIYRLSRLRGLRVIARGSAFQFKGRTANIRTAGQQLGVEYVLDGSVRVVNEHLRITVQMSDARTAYVLWSDRYERPWDKVLEVEEEIAASITMRCVSSSIRNPRQFWCMQRRTAKLMRITFGADISGTSAHPSPSKRACARMTLLFSTTRFAGAYAAIADTLLVMALNDQIATATAMSRARAAARQAIELQPDSPEALISVAGAKAIFDWDWEGSARDMQRALHIHPGSAAGHYLYAVLVLQPLARWTEAYRELEAACVSIQSRLCCCAISAWSTS